MKRRALLLLALALAPLPAAEAQDTKYHIRTQKIGNQSITTLTPLDQALPQPAEPTPQVLEAHDWKCGREFVDAVGRRWRLMSLQPQTDRPITMTGWLLPAAGGRTYFFNTEGRLFLRLP